MPSNRGDDSPGRTRPDLGGNSGLLFVLPLLMFVFSMALCEDYNILIMSRIRDEAHR